jgi:hypothetical protein
MRDVVSADRTPGQALAVRDKRELHGSSPAQDLPTAQAVCLREGHAAPHRQLAENFLEIEGLGGVDEGLLDAAFGGPRASN